MIMPVILNLNEIKNLIQHLDVIPSMQEGFVQYSNGQTVVPPVGELLFEDPPGDVHIKYGYIKKDDFYIIKIASGFYENPTLGIASGQGLMLVFKQKTGELAAVLLDEGYLTDIRTAAAGALATQYFAPKNVRAIGIIGTGVQAKFQLQYLEKILKCREVWLWGRNELHAEKLKQNLGSNWNIHIATSPSQVAHNCKLIVTTTPSETALFNADDIQAGTHITAVGSDTASKQELSGDLLQKADLIIADSLPQSKSRGEVYQAVKGGFIQSNDVYELGTAIQDPKLQRQNDHQITIVDLTCVAVQDIMIAKSVYLQHLLNQQHAQL